MKYSSKLYWSTYLHLLCEFRFVPKLFAKVRMNIVQGISRYALVKGSYETVVVDVTPSFQAWFSVKVTAGFCESLRPL